MENWFSIYKHRRKQIKRYQLTEGAEGSDASIEYIYNSSLLLKTWFWIKLFIFFIDLYYLSQCCLWVAFRSFFYYSDSNLVALNIVLMLILLTNGVFKIMMTPKLSISMFQMLGPVPKFLLNAQHFLRYDHNGIYFSIYLLYAISFFLPYPEAAYLHLVYTFKFIEINSFLSIIHYKIHTYKIWRVVYRLTLLLFIILYLSHLLAAIFYFIDQYLIEKQYFGDPSVNPKVYYQFNSVSFTPIEMLSEMERYIMAFYFANGLVSTEAYGDIVGQNWIQDSFVTVLMVASTVMVAFLLQQLMIMVEDNRFAIYEIIKNFRHLKQLMDQKDVPSSLQLKIRNYIFYIEYYNKFQNPEPILAKLTKKMQIDLYYKGYGPHLEKIFQPLGFTNIRKLCECLEQITFQPEIDIFLPEWKNMVNQSRECTLQLEVLEPSLLYLIKGSIFQYLQRDAMSTEFQMRKNESSVNLFEFLAKRHVRYGLRTKNLVKFITLRREKFQKLLLEEEKLRMQLAVQEEKIISNCISRKLFKDDCEVCGEEDHSIINCPDVHLVIDQLIDRAQKIGTVLKGRTNKRRLKKRKQKNCKRQINVVHYSSLFANLSLGALIQPQSSTSEPNLEMGVSYLQKSLKNLFERAHIQEDPDLQNQENIIDSAYDPQGLDNLWRIDHN